MASLDTHSEPEARSEPPDTHERLSIDLPPSSTPTRPPRQSTRVGGPPRRSASGDLSPRRLKAVGGGVSVLKPDPKKHAAIAHRQKLAEAKGPKPTPEQMKCERVLDPEKAATSTESKEAAREKWVAQMQERADPRNIRRAVQERQAQHRAEDREKLKAERERYEKKQHDQEVRRLATQQARTPDTAAKAHQDLASGETPVATPASEHVVPPAAVNALQARRRSFVSLSGTPTSTSPSRATKPAGGAANLRRPARTSAGGAATRRSQGRPSAEQLAEANREKLRNARLEHFVKKEDCKEVPETTGTEEVKEVEVASGAAPDDDQKIVVPEFEARTAEGVRPVAEWLTSQGLEAYAERLFDNGYDELSIFSQLRAPELEEMLEMTSVKAGHRVKFRRAVEALQARRPAEMC